MGLIRGQIVATCTTNWLAAAHFAIFYNSRKISSLAESEINGLCAGRAACTACANCTVHFARHLSQIDIETLGIAIQFPAMARTELLKRRLLAGRLHFFGG